MIGSLLRYDSHERCVTCCNGSGGGVLGRGREGASWGVGEGGELVWEKLWRCHGTFLAWLAIALIDISRGQSSKARLGQAPLA